MKSVEGSGEKCRDYAVWCISRLAYGACGVGPPNPNSKGAGHASCLGSVPLESPGVVVQYVKRNRCAMAASMECPQGGRLGRTWESRRKKKTQGSSNGWASESTRKEARTLRRPAGPQRFCTLCNCRMLVEAYRNPAAPRWKAIRSAVRVAVDG